SIYPEELSSARALNDLQRLSATLRMRRVLVLRSVSRRSMDALMLLYRHSFQRRALDNRRAPLHLRSVHTDYLVEQAASVDQTAARRTSSLRSTCLSDAARRGSLRPASCRRHRRTSRV